MACIAGFVLLRWLLSKSLHFSPQGKVSRLEILFILAFCWLGISILESVNAPLSFSKWVVFLFFSLFCASYSNLLKNRDDLVLTLFPFIVFFVVFAWMTLISARFYPQPLKSSVGYINGFLIFAPAVGHFLTAFGTPGILYILAHPLGKKMRIFLVITLFLGVVLTIYSGSRAGTFTTFFILGLALIKWKREPQLCLPEGHSFLYCVVFHRCEPPGGRTIPAISLQISRRK